MHQLNWNLWAKRTQTRKYILKVLNDPAIQLGLRLPGDDAAVNGLLLGAAVSEDSLPADFFLDVPGKLYLCAVVKTGVKVI